MLGNEPRQAIGLGTWTLKCKNMNRMYRTGSMRHSLLTASFRERATRVKDVRSAHAGFAGASHP